MPSSATAVYTAARVPPPEAATTSDGRCAAACASRRVASVSPVARACALSSASVTCSGLMALARTIGSTASGRDQLRCQKNKPDRRGHQQEVHQREIEVHAPADVVREVLALFLVGPSTSNSSTNP